MTLISRLLLLAILITALGCGGPSNVLTGEVKLDGQPLKTGSISLRSKDGDTQAFGATITDGKFEIGKLPEGTFVAEVSAATQSNVSTNGSDSKDDQVHVDAQSSEAADKQFEDLNYYRLVKNARGNRKEITVTNGENSVSIDLQSAN